MDLLLSSFAANELFWGLLFCVFVCLLGPLSFPMWLACTAGAFFASWAALVPERLRLKPEHPPLRQPAIPDFARRTCTSHDGLRLVYYVSRPRHEGSTGANGDASAGAAGAGAGGDGRRAVLLCAPLGQAGPKVFAPLLMTLDDTFAFVSWDYRGFFGSEGPARLRRISVAAHAEDGAAVLRAAGFASAHLVVGHSLGVQVALELTLLFPARVERLVLLNGCHGHAFHTAFQPVVRIPPLGTATFEFVRLLQERPWLFVASTRLLRPVIKHCVSRVFCGLFGSPLLRKAMGPDYLYDFWAAYVTGLGALGDGSSPDARPGRFEWGGDGTGEERNLAHFLFMFQEIHAHSCYHLLRKIDQPALVVSGMLDMLLPALVSREMAGQLRRGEHVCDPLSTHTTLLESPEWTLHQIHRFLRSTELEGVDLLAQDGRKSL